MLDAYHNLRPGHPDGSEHLHLVVIRNVVSNPDILNWLHRIIKEEAETRRNVWVSPDILISVVFADCCRCSLESITRVTWPNLASMQVQ